MFKSKFMANIPQNWVIATSNMEDTVPNMDSFANEPANLLTHIWYFLR